MTKNIEQAVKVLVKGGVLVYPTDTAYGLAVDATNAQAVKKLYRLKGRDFKKPIHVIPPTIEWLENLVKLNAPAKKIMRKFMPGPITLVLPLKAKGESFKMLSAGSKTLGIRFPDHKMVAELLIKFGKPITTTSANVAGHPNCYSISEVKKQFGKSIYKSIYFLDGGKLRKTKPSTVVMLTKGVKILREGPITEKQIKNALK